MPDAGAPVSIIQNSFATGEVAPTLYGRTDLAKYHAGCAVIRNFYVDYKGGVTTRPGTQYIGAPGSSGYTRLIPFQFTSTIGQTYMLVFSAGKIRIIKNPGGAAYPNSSPAGYILSGGVPLEIVTPYAEAALRKLHYAQIGDVLYLTVDGYARQTLSRTSDTVWTLAAIPSAPTISAPTISSIVISALPAGSTDPQNTYYMYAVSAVNADGEESFPSEPFISAAGINIGVTLGTVTVSWVFIANAVYYKVYKALPTTATRIVSKAEQLGFVGFAYGTVFTDSNVVPDFARQPLRDENPFTTGPLTGYNISASSGDWPVNGTTITVTGGGGSGAVVYPILSNNAAGGVGSITGLYIAKRGSYATAPTLTAVGGGTVFTATAIIGPTAGTEPTVVGFSQQRLIYASTPNDPNKIVGSRPGFLSDFRVSNPTVDNDSYNFNLFSREILNILWLQEMPGGLVIGTNGSIVQLTGGSSSAANPSAITPANAVIVPQSNYGTRDIAPQIVDYDIIFVTPEGLVIDLQYNFFVNIYTGTDVTVMSSHLFERSKILDWTYQDTPRKIIWSVRDDGTMLSLTWFKAQEISGWAQHVTQGTYEAVASVQEGDKVAVYLSVYRDNALRSIERMGGSDWQQRSDAWQLDAALSTASVFPAADLQPVAAAGTGVSMAATAAVFAVGDVGKIIYSGGAKAVVTSFVDTTHVLVDIQFPFSIAGTGLPVPLLSGTWELDPVVSVVSGLSHLNGKAVFALVDGAVQGPFTVSGGSVTLTTPGARVVVGLAYSCLLQPLYLDVQGETTLQGRRKKVAAASVRIHAAARLQYGSSFATVREWVSGVDSTDPALDLPYKAPDLFYGDQRIAIDQVFTVGGWVCVTQSYPLPATILSIIPEFAQGDTR